MLKMPEETRQPTAQEAWSLRINRGFLRDPTTPLLKRLAIPFALLLLGSVLCYVAYTLFPSRPDNEIPIPFLITIRSSAPLYSVALEISGIEHGPIALDISMVELSRQHKSIPVSVEVDSDVQFTCHRSGTCIYGLPVMGGFGRPVYDYHAELIERRFSYYGKPWNDLQITANAANFGFTSNGASALVMIPSFDYEAPGKTVVTTKYDI